MRAGAPIGEFGIPEAMVDDLEKALVDEIEDFSEDAFAATWMSDVEYELWRLLEGLGKPRYGMMEAEPARLDRIRRLRDAVGRWPVGYGAERVWTPVAQFAESFAGWYRESRAASDRERRKLLDSPVGPCDVEVLANVAARRFEIGDFASVRKLHAHGLVEYGDWTIFSAVPTEKGLEILKGARVPTTAR